MVKRKSLMILAGLVTAVVGIAAVDATIAFTNVQRIGPFYTTVTPFDSTNIGAVGGRVVTYLAGDSEFVGSLVYVSAKNTTKLDTVLTHYNNTAGVVVGGSRTGMRGSTDSSDVGTLVAIAGQRVLVATQGRVWVTVDTVGTGIAPGTAVIPSNKQGMRGRVAARTTIIDTFNRIVGRLVDTGVVNTKRLINLNVK